MTVQCIVGNTEKIHVYRLDQNPPRLVWDDEATPVVIADDGTVFNATLVQADERCVVVKCQDKWAPGGYVQFSFTGEHDPRPPKVTNDAPRRRTEPAITVPPTVNERINAYREGLIGRVLMTNVGPVNERSTYITWERYGDGWAEQTCFPDGTFFYERHAFSPAEAEHCKQHGAAAYESMAADIAQVRELARAAWVRSLPVWQPGETAGDFAKRSGMLPPRPGKREQWEDSVWLAAAERMALEMSDE